MIPEFKQPITYPSIWKPIKILISPNFPLPQLQENQSVTSIRTPSINAQCRSILTEILKLIRNGISYRPMSIHLGNNHHMSHFSYFTVHPLNVIVMFLFALIGIRHWSRESCNMCHKPEFMTHCKEHGSFTTSWTWIFHSSRFLKKKCSWVIDCYIECREWNGLPIYSEMSTECTNSIKGTSICKNYIAYQSPKINEIMMLFLTVPRRQLTVHWQPTLLIQWWICQ